MSAAVTVQAESLDQIRDMLLYQVQLSRLFLFLLVLLLVVMLVRAGASRG